MNMISYSSFCEHEAVIDDHHHAISLLFKMATFANCDEHVTAQSDLTLTWWMYSTLQKGIPKSTVSSVSTYNVAW